MVHQDIIAECNAEGIVTALRGPVTEVFGYRPDEVLGRPVVSFLHPHHRNLDVPVLGGPVEQPHADRWDEVRVQLPDGTWRWAEVSIHSGADADAPVVVVVRSLPDDVAAILDARQEPSDALAATERRFRQLAEAAPIGVFQEEQGLGLVYVNRRWQQITGLGRHEALGTGWHQLLHPDDRPDAAGYTSGEKGLHGLEQTQIRIVRPDGSVRWLEVGTAPVADEHGALTATVGTIDDITDTIEAGRHASRLSHVIEATSDLVGVYDFDDGRLYANEAARRFLGVDHATGATFHAALPDWMVVGWPDDVLRQVEADGLWSGEIELGDARGRAVPMSALMLGRLDHAGRLIGVSAVLRDISERRALEDRIEHQATHDPLTDLPNRVLLLDRLAVALGRATRTGIPLAVLLLDLDRFKVVNDSLGHALGDRVLMALAARIEAAVRPGDTVARFGGDEFVVLVEDLEDETEVVRLAQRLATVVGAPTDADGGQIVISASIGIAISGSSDGETPETLLRDADAAMYRAKAQGAARHEIFDARLRTEVVDRLDLESALRHAVRDEQLHLRFQPKIDLVTGRIVGFEALVRWDHPTRGLLGPDEFLPIAEETGLILEVGAWVLDRACAALVRLDRARPEGESPLYLCVNLSATELDDPGLVDSVRGCIERHGIRADHLDIEITEHTLMRDVDRANRALRQLKELGIMVAVDDFGTGYSSLAYLRSFPVDLLKIDRTFVAGLGGEKPEDAAIVTAVATLAGTLGLAVVAEGVETAEQLAELRRIGCSMAQGYFIGRPMPLADALALTAASPTW